MSFKPLALAAAATTVLAACGSDYNDNNTVTPDPVSAPAPAPAPAPVVQNFPVQTVAPVTFNANEAGTILVSAEGLSLYFFANDVAGLSNCNADESAPAGSSTDPDSCAGRWPPLLVGEGATADAPYSHVERADGTMQWAYLGYPLYQFIQDTAQGDVLGDGLGEVWDLARTAPINSFDADSGPLLTARNQVYTATIVAGELAFTRMEKDGFSLYTFDNDPLDTANCFNLGDGGCINAWPPLLADGGAKPSGLYDVVTQPNGVMQWTFRGKPLYLFASDLQAGDTNGQGAGDVWYLATQEPAIQRNINDASWLTATGRVSMLTQTAEGNLERQEADKDQFSLYTFANDEMNVSNCSGTCLASWPAFLATDYDIATGDFTIFERGDGYKQWAYQGQPLYFFVNDVQIDDTNGQGLGEVWYLVPPARTEFAPTESSLGNTLTTTGRVKMLQVNADNEFEVVTSDKTGFQLYTFDVDMAEISNCNSSGCIGDWPALLATEHDEALPPFSLFEREDGYLQWALNNKPLYFFTPDTNPGDQLGESVGDVWWIARAAPLRLSSLDNIGSAFVANRLDISGSERNNVNRESFTLYTFGNDVANSGESTCTGGCAEVWPPLYASDSSQAYGEYGVIQRTDAQGETAYQWTYKGMPLYFFANDAQVGDANGHELNNFQVAIPN